MFDKDKESNDVQPSYSDAPLTLPSHLTSQQKEQLMDLLVKVLQAEYDGVFLYPRHAKKGDMPQEVADTLYDLGNDEVKHYDTVASLLRRLGEDPVWEIPSPAMEDSNIAGRIKRHLSLEDDTLRLYQECLAITNSGEIGRILSWIRKDEERHHRILNELMKQYA